MSLNVNCTWLSLVGEEYDEDEDDECEADVRDNGNVAKRPSSVNTQPVCDDIIKPALALLSVPRSVSTPWISKLDNVFDSVSQQKLTAETYNALL